MDISIGICLPRSVDKLFDKLVIFLSSNAWLPQAQVQIVLEEFPILLFGLATAFSSMSNICALHLFRNQGPRGVVLSDESQHKE